MTPEVVTFKGNFPLGKSPGAIVSIVGAVVVIVVSGLFLFLWKSPEWSLSQPNQDAPVTSDLGITYLPVTRGLAEYYSLGVTSGALVTEVVPGSPADQAGIQKGDVILSFNGEELKDEAPLLGMVMSCPAGHDVVLEVSRGRDVKDVQLLHMTK